MKRSLDVIFAFLGLAVMGPLLLMIAGMVRIFMGSPVLFRQVRPGLGGQPFTLYKFRSMRELLNEDGKPLTDQKRLTSFGSFLRQNSLDELPQLLNILRGEMSFIGPRPLLTEYLSLYSPKQTRRHEVRPGITGWAQVHGRNDTTWEERLARDVWYVDHQSLKLDLRILVMTFKLIRHQEGICTPGHVTMPKFTGGGQK